jgi:hypothetical protein
LFNPCADLANRRAAVQRQMNQVSGRRFAGADNAASIRAKLAALGCTASPAKKRAARAAPAISSAFGYPTVISFRRPIPSLLEKTITR